MGAHDAAREGRDRGDEQDPAEAAGLHPGHGALREQERRAEVDREHLVEVAGGHLLEGLPAAQAGSRDQDLHRAQPRLDRVDQLAGALGTAQIGSGVTVNTIAPALITETGMLPGDPEELRSRVPVGRLGQPDEVADLALAVLRNPYMTNQVVSLDGGMYPR